MAKRVGKRTTREAASAGTTIVPLERIEQSIFVIHGLRVMLDMDLAAFFGVPTRALNQAVKRNQERFPADFCFQLTRGERDELVTNCDNLNVLKYSPTCPRAFTEHGALMAATVLNSPRAVQMSVLVVRAFVRLRQILATHRDLARRLEALEREFLRRTDAHEAHIHRIYEILDELMEPPAPPKKRRIGFLAEG
jgi:hypothetical protein